MSNSSTSAHDITATGDSNALSAVAGGIDVNIIGNVSMQLYMRRGALTVGCCGSAGFLRCN